MPDKRYTKVEEEVIQILDRLESEKPAPARPNLRLVEPRGRRGPRRMRRLSLSRVTAGKPWFWIAAAMGLAFAALLVRDPFPNLALALAIGSICSFFAPIFVSRRPTETGTGGPIGEIKQWRGRDISLDPSTGPSPAERLSQWWQDRRRRGPRL